MRMEWMLLCCLPLAGQRPEGLRQDFFARDPAQVAVDAADKARVQARPSASTLAACGRAYLKARQKERAEEAFRRALALEDAEARLAVAQAWLEAGQWGKALPLLTTMPTTGRGDVEPAAQAAALLLKHGKPAEAKALQDKVAAASPKDWRPCVGFAAAALQTGQRELATLWFERAVALQPTGTDIWLAIAHACAESVR